MVRPVLYALSRSHLVPRMIGHVGWAREAARRFVAGETLDEAIETVRRLNERDLLGILNYLGEHTITLDDAARARLEYLDTLDAIHDHGIDAYLSIKLSQLGLDLDEALCRDHLSALLERAGTYGIFVRLDMESSAYTDRTIELYCDLFREFPMLGTVIQANLRRSAADVDELIRIGASVRLVKGAYIEPPDVAYEAKQDVDSNYLRLLDRLLSPEAQQRGVRVAVATHDPRIVRWTKDETRERGIPRDRFEFQMLYGIRRDLQRRLVAQGYRVRVYVPYGAQWYPYLMRRLAERPANLLFLIRNLVRG